MSVHKVCELSGFRAFRPSGFSGHEKKVCVKQMELVLLPFRFPFRRPLRFLHFSRNLVPDGVARRPGRSALPKRAVSFPCLRKSTGLVTSAPKSRHRQERHAGHQTIQCLSQHRRTPSTRGSSRTSRRSAQHNGRERYLAPVRPCECAGSAPQGREEFMLN
jgi:hypothetical protein